MGNSELQLTLDSLKTELKSYEDKPYGCLFEYVWNSFDANASEVQINYKLPKLGFGYVEDISIEDNGGGWNFEKEKNTKTFLSSSKQNKIGKRTLPRGRFGRGRYVFIWIAESIEIFSSNQRLKLNQDTKVDPEDDNSAPKKGTKIIFNKPTNNFSDILFNRDKLVNELILEFCWFLKENPSFSIIVNGEKIDPQSNIKKEKKFRKNDFDKKIQEYLSDGFEVNVVLWKEKPAEWSSFYFIDENTDKEIFTQSTSMNKKRDDFWHSVYIKSVLFQDGLLDENETIDAQLDLGDKEKKKINNEIIRTIKQKLVELRKPYLVQQSDFLISDLKSENIIPNLSDFGIYDEKSYEDLLKTIYTISPSLFTGKDKKEKKFICTTFAGLLSTQDNNLVKIVLEQLQDLTEDEKQDLLDILQRTTLSNVVKTVKEIDHRLQVISDLMELLFKYKAKTLEVKHLQQVLNDNFWIFGEQFRLFSNTEGALKTTLFEYAKNILEIDNPEIITDSRKEVDLFLVKTEPENENCQKNIIIEIKRPSIKLGKEEYDQIEKYSIDIMNESICNGENIYWEFYLIGDDYDDYIAKTKIENAKNNGEIKRGLTSNLSDGRIKIYVRKWSDILQVEWGYKMQFLKKKLEIQSKNNNYNNPDDIVKNLSPSN
jgi:hypothetical protein